VAAAPAIAGSQDHPFADAPMTAVSGLISSISTTSSVAMTVAANVLNAITDGVFVVVRPELDRKIQVA
jgi:hypothetical protein